MKKYTLFILISLMAFSVFSVTQEEKEKIFDAIVKKSKAPRISTVRSRLNYAFRDDCTTITNQHISEAIERDETTAYEAEKYLNSLPPSTLIPAFYELRLEGKLRTNANYYATMWGSETNKYDKSKYLYILNDPFISNGIPIVRKKRELAEIVIRHSRCEGFVRGDLIGMINPKASYESNFRAYWWLEGRRFMPEIWNVWYPCWQNEMSRKKPRESVTEQLVEDIGCFGTFLFPHLNEAIKEGDYTLTPVLEKITYDTDIELPPAKEFCEWYSTNHFKYDYPPCEGIRKTIEKVKDPYILSELKGEDTYDDRKKYGDKWAFHSFERNVFKQVLWQAEDYYNKREYPPDYWYYKLPDEADYEYPSEIPSFSGSTNFNKGFLKKIEEKRK